MEITVVAGFPRKVATMILGLIVVTDDRHFEACVFIKKPTPPTEAPTVLRVAEEVISV